MQHILEDRVILQVLSYYLDGFELLALSCVSRSLRDTVPWNLFAEGKEHFKERHFYLRKFLGDLKTEKMKLKKTAIANIRALKHAPTILVEAFRDARDPAFHEPTMEDFTCPMVLHDTVAKKSKPVFVPLITEMIKKYGNISAFRHDFNGSYLYFATRHFPSDGGQHELIWHRTSEINFDCEVTYECLGRLDMNRTNFPAGVEFVHKGDAHYLIGECYEEFTLFDLSTLKPLPVPAFKADFGRDLRWNVLPDQTLFVYNNHKKKKKSPQVYTIPDFTLVAEAPNYNVSFFHPPAAYDNRFYYLEKGRVLDYLSDAEILVVEKMDQNKYIPYPSDLLAVDRDHVLWCQFPSGNIYIDERKPGGMKHEIVHGKWNKKEYYHVFFTGESIVWYDINEFVMHIVTPAVDSSGPKKKKSFLKSLF